MEHLTKIVSLYDAQLECSCGWSLVYTGAYTKTQARRELDRHLYQEYAAEWRKTHSLSNPPSFTSWKRYYSTKAVVTN